METRVSPAAHRKCERLGMADAAAVAEVSAGSRSPGLLSNWVEERATAVLDGDPSCVGDAHRYGHRGILTNQLLDHIADNTTQRDSYGKPSRDPTRQTGRRDELIFRFLYHKFSQEVLEAQTFAPAEPSVTESTTRTDFQAEGFVVRTPLPSKKVDYSTDRPVTFWTENLRSVTGVSDIRSRDTPFKKSSAFTTPTSQYLDQPAPHSLENYPNM